MDVPACMCKLHMRAGTKFYEENVFLNKYSDRYKIFCKIHDMEGIRI